MSPLFLSFILGCQEKKDTTTEEVIEDTQVTDNTDDTNTETGDTDDTYIDTADTNDTNDTNDTGSTEDTGNPVDTGTPPNPVMDFSRVNVNPNSASFGTSISPRDYLQQISGWYFIKAT